MKGNSDSVDFEPRYGGNASLVSRSQQEFFRSVTWKMRPLTTRQVNYAFTVNCFFNTSYLRLSAFICGFLRESCNGDHREPQRPCVLITWCGALINWGAFPSGCWGTRTWRRRRFTRI